MKYGLPAGWDRCPVWRAWVCEGRAVVAVPEGILWTAGFLLDFCASVGGCPIHPSTVAAEGTRT